VIFLIGLSLNKADPRLLHSMTIVELTSFYGRCPLYRYYNPWNIEQWLGIWERQMPQMTWEEFNDAHYRPNLVIAKLLRPETVEESTAILARLAEALPLKGNYSLMTAAGSIHAAFELDVDAAHFAKAVRAQPTERGSEWASRASFVMGKTARNAITSALQPFRLKSARKP